ncbi:MAG: hypothetical protein D6781_10635 [Verrucomicrobia bacterium]|nr:MAG: hypothetical protein D6781_10635 [Verrucomicrobiota bacterium]
MLLAALAATGTPPLDLSQPALIQALVVGLLIFGVSALAALANYVTAIVDRFRRKPPLEQQLAAFATRAELNSLDSRLSSQISEVRRHISDSHNKIYVRIEAEAANTRNNITSLGKTIEAEFRTLYRALGKIEGLTLEDPRRG